MAQLEKELDEAVQKETETKTSLEIESENTGEQQESTSSSDAFDITRKFKHNQNQISSQRRAGKEPQQESEIPKKRELVGVTDKKVETKRILFFLALCFGVAWVSEIFAVIPMYQRGDVDVVKEASNMLSQLMLTPALAALVVRIGTREGLAKSGFQFNFFEHKVLFLFGWFGTTVLTFLGAVIYFLVFRDNFDPNMTNFVAYSESMADTGTQIDAVNIVAAYKTDLLIKVFTAAVLDMINSFGEEWGFRAYLLPKLYRKFGAVPAMLISGLVSGLWYAPLVAVGYYYGIGNAGFPVVNIIAMCIFSMVTGVIYSYLCLRTGSIFPAVFAHSAVNVMMSQAALFTFDGGNLFVGPSPTGILSGLPFIATAVVCLVLMHKNPVKPSGE
ncbi:MAG: CPBP family intramembrane metalloprotease [Lachnospiraceae bacterium]|nr:CPBP family intramembrane metalloprotease [Lachnospiraceae bacterium]